MDVFFCSPWKWVGFAALFLLLVWIILYLVSLRTQYSLRGKHVLITGGSSGIGKALARESLRRGAAVVTILARNKENLKAARTELERLISAKLPQKVHTISADVTSESVKDDLEQELSGLPPVDVLINSAGIGHSGAFLDTPPEIFDTDYRVNVLGSVRPTQALLPQMISRGGGRIVFISSMAGQVALYGYTAYSASKYAVRGLAEVLDMELKVHNVRVSISFPPDTDTPMYQEELKHRSPVQAVQAEYGSVFDADTIARDICRGVERGKFLISHGFDGFLLSTITTGMSPAYHWVTVLTEVLLLGLFRLLGCAYIMLFYNIVNREINKAKKKT